LGATHPCITRLRGIVPRPMERIDENTYVCTLCHANVKVESDERPVVTMVAQSGEPNLRVVTVEGVEVHRCVIPNGPRTVRMT